jgi:hypothetical protein
MSFGHGARRGFTCVLDTPSAASWSVKLHSNQRDYKAMSETGSSGVIARVLSIRICLA